MYGSHRRRRPRPASRRWSPPAGRRCSGQDASGDRARHDSSWHDRPPGRVAGDLIRVGCRRRKSTDGGVEVVGGFDVADMPCAGQDDEGRTADRGMEVLGDGERRPHITVAVHQQRRNLDARQRITEVLGGRTGHGPEPDRMERPHAPAKASIISCEVPSENIVGNRASTNSSGERSASTSACPRRCWVTSAGREPAHPA